jgi:hypothetical protein
MFTPLRGADELAAGHGRRVLARSLETAPD